MRECPQDDAVSPDTSQDFQKSSHPKQNATLEFRIYTEMKWFPMIYYPYSD